MKDSLHTIIYATILGIVCALLLTGAAQITEPYQKRNAEAEKMRSILGVLEAEFAPEASSKELVEIYKKNVREEQYNQLTVYVYAPAEAQGAIQAVAVDFAGPGLWGPIKGFLSLEPDRKTIRGIVFYEQEETPGLGGDIDTEGFRNQFKGKTIEDETGRPGIRIVVREEASAVNEVDAISGATMTCNKVEEMLNEVIQKIYSMK